MGIGDATEKMAGEEEYQIVLTGGRCAFLGRANMRRIQPGKGYVRVGDRKKYRKTDLLMLSAAVALVPMGWKAAHFERLFGISRSSAFRLARRAKEEINAT